MKTVIDTVKSVVEAPARQSVIDQIGTIRGPKINFKDELGSTGSDFKRSARLAGDPKSQAKDIRENMAKLEKKTFGTDKLSDSTDDSKGGNLEASTSSPAIKVVKTEVKNDEDVKPKVENSEVSKEVKTEVKALEAKPPVKIKVGDNEYTEDELQKLVNPVKEVVEVKKTPEQEKEEAKKITDDESSRKNKWIKENASSMPEIEISDEDIVNIFAGGHDGIKAFKKVLSETVASAVLTARLAAIQDVAPHIDALRTASEPVLKDYTSKAESAAVEKFYIDNAAEFVSQGDKDLEKEVRSTILTNPKFQQVIKDQKWTPAQVNDEVLKHFKSQKQYIMSQISKFQPEKVEVKKDIVTKKEAVKLRPPAAHSPSSSKSPSKASDAMAAMMFKR